MTSKSQYEANLDAFGPYYYDDENHIDLLTPIESLIPIPILTTGHAHALCSQEARRQVYWNYKSALPKSALYWKSWELKDKLI
jgi:hypothetical protein